MILSEILRLIDDEDELRAMFSGQQMTKYRQVEVRLAENPAARPFRVVFCGVFSSGKTSLINALLSSSFSLPQGINPVTKMVTRVSPGSEVTCAYRPDRLEKKRVPVPTDYLTALIQGKKQLVLGGSELLVTIPSALLHGNVEWLDTPGFNDEMGGELEEMSREAIYEADMAVLCCNSLQLGKIIERDLVSELNELLGHFALVITRMDNLNTPEDREGVVAQANRLMAHQGNDAAVFPGDPVYVFPVVTGGVWKDIGSFQNYFKAILEDDDIRRRIRNVSDSKCLTACLLEIQPILDGFLQQRREELADVMRRNDEAVRRQQRHAQAERDRLMSLRQSAAYAASDLAARRVNDFARDISLIPNPAIFQSEANQLAVKAVIGLVNDLAAYAERNRISDYSSVKIVLSQAYDLRGFTVPPPVRQSVKSRGLVRRGLATAANLATLKFKIDDGCDEVYADYCGPAAEALRGGPMETVIRQWNAYLDTLCGNMRTDGFSGGLEQAIRERQTLIARCEAILRKMA